VPVGGLGCFEVVFRLKEPDIGEPWESSPPCMIFNRIRSNPVQRLGLFSLQVINLACAFHLFTEYVGTISFMEGPSMLPTLANSGEIVIENIFSYRLRPNNLARGDLITFRSPLDPSRMVCKRVIGLPGDVVCVDPTGEKAPSEEHVLVPKGHVWVSGDNTACSNDSRDHGPVSMALIRAKLYARVWPPKDFTIFRNPTTFID